MSTKPLYGASNPTPEEFEAMPVKRYASAIELIPEKEEYYRELHANVWPKVLEQIKDSNIQNYFIYTADLGGKKYLISHFEYVGKDLKADMAKMAEDETTQKWWKETDPCQRVIDGTPEGESWKPLEMVFAME